jgi:hypothetical protein
MKLSELIKLLEAAQSELGDVEAFCDQAGLWLNTETPWKQNLGIHAPSAPVTRTQHLVGCIPHGN